MPNEEMRQFLTEGVGRYGEVIGVIDAFKDGLRNWLAEILKAYDKWPKSFDPDPKGTTTRGLSKYIYAEMPGLLGGRKTKLSIGLWCGHSFATDSESIIYAEIRFDGQAEKTPFTDNVTTERVKIHSPWLYVEVSASPDVEHDCRALLEEVAAQLPSMEAGAT